MGQFESRLRCRWRDWQALEIGDIVALIEAKEAENPLERGPYKSCLGE
ncbi:hypothetical protein [Mesorhizobium sp.]|nr:hypothetical protein [Mesorhizobium sp.]